jgi:3-methyladenine DNA glycosylase/8-oxoguanine DNA glycosylase
MVDTTRLGGHPGRSRSDPWRAARRELSGRCPRLAELVRLAHPIPREIPDPRPVTHLAVRTVVSQLVSVAAARTIVGRLLDAHGSFEGVVAWARATPVDAPPTLGLSRAKRRAVAAWGDFVEREGDPRTRWSALDAEALLAEITALRGFGRWSAEMLAIFAFGHPDIWPEGDAGVVRVMRRLYPRRKPPSIRARVRGQSTYAALCCWTVIDRGLEREL